MTKFTKGQVAWNKGLKGFNKGHPKYSDGMSFLGKKHTIETKEKMRLAKLGKKGVLSNNWRGGVTQENQLLRGSPQYFEWRAKVLFRDKWTCAHCQKVGGKLNVHNIQPWSKSNDLRFSIDNGITLCIECHKNLHKVVR